VKYVSFNAAEQSSINSLFRVTEISVDDCWLASIAVSELHCHDAVDMCFWVYDVTMQAAVRLSDHPGWHWRGVYCCTCHSGNVRI